MSEAPTTPCSFSDFERDEQGCYPLTALIVATKDCTPPEGACFSSSDTAADDREAPPPAPHRKPKRKAPMSDTTPLPSKTAVDHANAATIPDDHVDDFSPAPVEAAPQAHTAASEIAAFLPKDGAGSGITVMLALIAVAGGGAGWKFYQSLAKQKHEQRMKELDLADKRLDKHDADDHKACEAARAADRAALEDKIAALETRLADAEKAKADAKSVSDFSFDAEDFNERIEQIERALKKAPSEKRRPRAK